MMNVTACGWCVVGPTMNVLHLIMCYLSIRDEIDAVTPGFIAFRATTIVWPGDVTRETRILERNNFFVFVSGQLAKGICSAVAVTPAIKMATVMMMLAKENVTCSRFPSTSRE